MIRNVRVGAPPVRSAATLLLAAQLRRSIVADADQWRDDAWLAES